MYTEFLIWNTDGPDGGVEFPIVSSTPVEYHRNLDATNFESDTRALADGSKKTFEDQVQGTSGLRLAVVCDYWSFTLHPGVAESAGVHQLSLRLAQETVDGEFLVDQISSERVTPWVTRYTMQLTATGSYVRTPRED